MAEERRNEFWQRPYITGHPELEYQPNYGLPQPKKEESVNKLYIKVQNGTKPYINKDGEVVIDLRPGKVNIDIKEISVDGVSFRVVHSYKDKNTGDDKYRIGDRGFIKVNKNHELNISRKTEGKA